jgi:hypothetical protein
VQQLINLYLALSRLKVIPILPNENYRGHLTKTVGTTHTPTPKHTTQYAPLYIGTTSHYI